MSDAVIRVERQKIDIFFAASKLTGTEYTALTGLLKSNNRLCHLGKKSGHDQVKKLVGE